MELILFLMFGEEMIRYSVLSSLSFMKFFTIHWRISARHEVILAAMAFHQLPRLDQMSHTAECHLRRSELVDHVDGLRYQEGKCITQRVSVQGRNPVERRRSRKLHPTQCHWCSQPVVCSEDMTWTIPGQCHQPWSPVEASGEGLCDQLYQMQQISPKELP